MSCLEKKIKNLHEQNKLLNWQHLEEEQEQYIEVVLIPWHNKGVLQLLMGKSSKLRKGYKSAFEFLINKGLLSAIHVY